MDKEQILYKKMDNLHRSMDVIIEGIRATLSPPEFDVEEEKKLKERDKKPEYSNQFYCHGCNQWIPCKNDFTPYDCPCGKSRWGD